MLGTNGNSPETHPPLRFGIVVAQRQRGRSWPASPEDFVAHATAYLDAGFTDLQIPWPRTDHQYAVMHQAARDCIPMLRNAYQSKN